MNAALRKLVNEGRAAWPNVRIDEEAFARHVLTLTKGNLEGVRAGDLYLVFACGAMEPNAIAAFERELLPKAVSAAMRIDNRPELGEEVASRLRDDLLFTNQSGAPAILLYAGRGPLENWVRTAATRLAFKLKPRRDEVDAAELGGDERLATADPEMDFLKGKYRADFKAAFEEAVHALSNEDINLLRLNTLDKVSIDRLCEMYKVHRATAARRIAKAREQLMLGTREALARRLKLDRRELDSVMKLVRSNLDLSLPRLLKR